MSNHWFMDMLFGEPDTHEGMVARDLGGIYLRTRNVDRLADKALDYFTGTPNLDEEQKRLDVMLKKKQLGLPFTSDELEDATNDDSSFLTHAMTLAGRKISQLVPSPELLDGAKLPWSNTAFNADRGILNAITGVGGKYVGPVRRLFG